MDKNKHNIRAKDPIDLLIFEKGIKIKNLFIDKDADTLILLLTNGKILKSKLSNIAELSNANQEQLNTFRIIGGGIGIEWEELEVDLSLKGFIKNAAINNIINQLTLSAPNEPEFV